MLNYFNFVKIKPLLFEIFLLISFILFFLFNNAVSSSNVYASNIQIKQELENISNSAINDILKFKTVDAKFQDPIGKQVGTYGLNRVNYVLLNQVSRNQDINKINHANQIFQRGSGNNNLLENWPLIMIFSKGLDKNIDENQRQNLLNKINNLNKMSASGIANICYQKTNCYNNYYLIDQVLNSELSLLNLNSNNPNSKVNKIKTEDNLNKIIKLVNQASNNSMKIKFQKNIKTGRVLSDPHTYPLAYHVFSTALLTRIIDNYKQVYSNRKEWKALIQMHKETLWATLALTAPSSESSWMGRGQDGLWVIASNLYAATKSIKLYKESDPLLTAQLNSLLQMQSNALKSRFNNFTIFPNSYTGYKGYAGLDSYVSYIGNASLALVFIELAIDELEDFNYTNYKPTVSQQASSFIDKKTSLAGLRYKNNWIGLHLKEMNNDRRYGFGALKSLKYNNNNNNNNWKTFIPNLPISRNHQNPPSSYPIFKIKSKKYVFKYNDIKFRNNKIELLGKANNRNYKLIYKLDDNFNLNINCYKNSKLYYTVWLESLIQNNRKNLKSKNFSVESNKIFKYKKSKTRYSSSRELKLYPYKLEFKCKKNENVKIIFKGNKIITP